MRADCPSLAETPRKPRWLVLESVCWCLKGREAPHGALPNTPRKPLSPGQGREVCVFTLLPSHTSRDRPRAPGCTPRVDSCCPDRLPKPPKRRIASWPPLRDGHGSGQLPGSRPRPTTSELGDCWALGGRMGTTKRRTSSRLRSSGDTVQQVVGVLLRAGLCSRMGPSPCPPGAPVWRERTHTAQRGLRTERKEGRVLDPDGQWALRSGERAGVPPSWPLAREPRGRPRTGLPAEARADKGPGSPRSGPLEQRQEPGGRSCWAGEQVGSGRARKAATGTGTPAVTTNRRQFPAQVVCGTRRERSVSCASSVLPVVTAGLSDLMRVPCGRPSHGDT